MKIPPPRRRRLPPEDSIIYGDPPPGWRPPASDDDTPDVGFLKLQWDRTEKAVWHMLFIVALKRLTRAAGPACAEQLMKEYYLVAQTIRTLAPGPEALRWLADVFRALEAAPAPGRPRGTPRKTPVSDEMLAAKCEYARQLVWQARREVPGRRGDRVAHVQQILDTIETFPSPLRARSKATATAELADDWVFAAKVAASDAAVELVAKRYDLSHAYLTGHLLPAARRSPIAPLLRYLVPTAR